MEQRARGHHDTNDVDGYGIKAGFYFSQIDWSWCPKDWPYPGYPNIKNRPEHGPPAFAPENKEKFAERLQALQRTGRLDGAPPGSGVLFRNGQELTFRHNDGTLTIVIPAELTTKLVNVVEVQW
jgi:hypothetical protein